MRFFFGISFQNLKKTRQEKNKQIQLFHFQPGGFNFPAFLAAILIQLRAYREALTYLGQLYSVLLTKARASAKAGSNHQAGCLEMMGNGKWETGSRLVNRRVFGFCLQEVV